MRPRDLSRGRIRVEWRDSTPQGAGAAAARHSAPASGDRLRIGLADRSLAGLVGSLSRRRGTSQHGSGPRAAWAGGHSDPAHWNSTGRLMTGSCGGCGAVVCSLCTEGAMYLYLHVCRNHTARKGRTRVACAVSGGPPGVAGPASHRHSGGIGLGRSAFSRGGLSGAAAQRNAPQRQKSTAGAVSQFYVSGGHHKNQTISRQQKQKQRAAERRTATAVDIHAPVATSTI